MGETRERRKMFFSFPLRVVRVACIPLRTRLSIALNDAVLQAKMKIVVVGIMIVFKVKAAIYIYIHLRNKFVLNLWSSELSDFTLRIIQLLHCRALYWITGESSTWIYIYIYALFTKRM